MVISSAESWASRLSTSTSSYSLKSLPYSLAGVVSVVVFVVAEVCNEMTHALLKKSVTEKPIIIA